MLPSLMPLLLPPLSMRLLRLPMMMTLLLLRAPAARCAAGYGAAATS
jgi:hypothetical protein